MTFIFFLLLIGCSTEENKEVESIRLSGIEITDASLIVPKENEIQYDVLIKPIIENTDNIPLLYEWQVNQIIIENINSDQTTDSAQIISREYFLDIANDGKSAILSSFKDGYYKITLSVYDYIEYKETALIIQLGQPVNPELYVSFNLPPTNQNSNNSVFTGKIFYQFKDEFNTSELTSLNADIIGNGWYNTAIKVNPLRGFGIHFGSLITNNKTDDDTIIKEIATIDSIETNQFRTTPLSFLNGLNRSIMINNRLEFKENIIDQTVSYSLPDNTDISDGSLFIGALTWGFNDKNVREFNFISSIINSENIKVTQTYRNKFLIKVFAGSIGIKPANSNYFIYFTPAGINSNDIDPNSLRAFPGAPYGAIIGRLGTEGIPFHIGSFYEHSVYITDPIYSINDNKEFVRIN